MTNKIQISYKYPDGAILVIGGETPDEFLENFNNMAEFRAHQEANYQASNNGNGTRKLTSNAGDEPFQVENIKLASGGDHPRWVVQGGNFKQFGVTCWPETLEKAGILGKLDPMKDNKPNGTWFAHYSTKDNGKPDKVVLLERGN